MKETESLYSWVINYNQFVSNDPWMIHFWWPRLLEDPMFRKILKDRWMNFRKGPLSNSAVNELVDNYLNYLILNGAVKRNYEKWDQGIGVNYEDTILFLKQFLIERASWMDTQVSSF